MEEGVELCLPESVLGGARGPVPPQLGKVDVLLAVAGLDRGGLSRIEPARRLLVHALDDLRPPGRELCDSASRYSLEVGQTLRRRFPLDAERARELGPQLGLVEVAGGEPVGLQDRLAVECAPLAVARRLGEVADDHVRVQMRVLRPRGAVLVSRGDEPRCVLAVDPAGAAADDAGLVLEICERGLPGRGVCLVDGTPGFLVAECV